MQNYSTLIMIALMVVAFYLLILRPQKKRQQAIQQTLSSLGPGSRVLLGSGLFGTVVAIGERQAVLEISPGVELTVLKQAIVRTVTDADEDDLEELEDDDAADEVLAEPEPLAPQDIDYTRGSDHLGSTSVDAAAPDRTTPSAGADPKRLG
jgi:preprotein translocase subunit YajC